MATYLSIAAVCEAVVQLLRSSYQADNFTQIELDFKVYGSQDFASAMQAGVSLFPYRVVANGSSRLPVGRLGPDGRNRRPPLPLEVHFLLTAWAKDSSLQNTVAGWMMRALETSPILTPSLLNATWPNVFRPDETVELVLADLSTQDLLHMWDRLTGKGYQLTVPYLARIVYMEAAT